MARLLIDGDDLVVRPAWWERIATGHGEIRMPLSDVSRIGEASAWWRPMRGEPQRTSYLPGLSHLGVWRHGEGRDFIAVHPWRPVVVVETRGQAPFDRIAISVPDAHAAADLLPADKHQRPWGHTPVRAD
ncbi:hypothetical protein ACH4RA_04010 [Streptomyces smyrnaeus]|uniref:hypothetical protein n=1 Tax=Streptomyces TaxID=1883 RepID=UPI000C1A4DCB|nr:MULTISPECIES: hypothetical protein [unclassified Streptomyces]MBQ0863606.1 hypothetical protein [Streptomyces sp. RK75]MBQ1124147.1 hypothetical protein [Streptomyces sp. B15]MBQ1159715.1 hypothetical protein [Streptomyces sp. A73]